MILLYIINYIVLYKLYIYNTKFVYNSINNVN